MTLLRGDRALLEDDLRRSRKELPPALLDFLSSVDNYSRQKEAFLLTWPEANSLYHSLIPQTSERLQLECEAVARLKPGSRPTGFALHWTWDPSEKRLERRLVEAERYLGKGWFQQGDVVWPLDKEVPPNAVKWLDLKIIPAKLVFQLVSTFVPTCQRLGWPVYTDLHIQSDITLHLEIVRMLKRTLEIRMSSNADELLSALTVLDGDGENLLSGHTLLPGLRTLLTSRLLKIAQAGEAVTLSGEELPAFIAEDLRPRANRLGVDLSQIDEKYPITDADKLEPTWQLEYAEISGVGVYTAQPYFVTPTSLIPFKTLAVKAAKGQRYIKDETGWIAISSNFKGRLNRWAAGGVEKFRLHPKEILGYERSRLQSRGIEPPQIVLPERDTSEQEDALRFFMTLRQHGIPGGLSGMQTDCVQVLTACCKALLNDNHQARILWITPRKKQQAVLDSLRTTRVPTTAGAFSTISGRVVVATPQEPIAPSGWTLIIFQDIDILASSSQLGLTYGRIERQWTLATFAKPDWHEKLVLAHSVMQIFNLPPQNFRDFQSRFVRGYQDQAETLLSRLASPFKKVSTGTAATDSNAVPIPPRPTPIPPPAPKSTPTRQLWAEVSSGPSIQIRYSASPEKSFFEEAKRWANRTEIAAEYVPFMQYWPTYAAMTPAQQRWYFYWRTQVRQGNLIPTDLSYLFVHIYEAINMVGFQSAQDAFTHLVDFWKHYRTLQPKLDKYLVDWIADFLLVHKLSEDALPWYAQALAEGAIGSEIDLSVEAWLQTGHDVTILPDQLLQRLSGYSLGKSKFYQEHNEQGALDAAYRKGLAAIDGHLKQTGTSLFEFSRAGRKHTVKRTPFLSALHAHPGKQLTIASVYPWSTSEKLATNLTAILKYTENVLRTQANYRSKLRGFTLREDWQAILDVALAPEVQRREIELDLGKLQALQQETEAVRNTLQERLGEQEAEEISTPTPREVMITPEPETQPAEAETAFIARPADAPDGMLTDLNEVAGIINRSEQTLSMLRLLRVNDWEMSKTTLEQKLGDNGFLSVQLDAINERAYEQLGDSLIFDEGELLVVAEDYRDELEYLLDLPDGAPVDSSTENEEEADADLYASLSEEWAAFARQLTPTHWEALAALLSGADVANRLEAVARSAFIPSSRLTDELNEFALDTIGDIVIEITDAGPGIEEEDVEPLGALLEWAHGTVLLTENRL